MLVANQQPTELSEPSVGALHNPAASITSQFSPIFIASQLIVVSIGYDQLDGTFLESLTERVRVVGSIGNHTLELLSWTAFGTWDTDFPERGFRKRNFTRGGTFQPNSQRNTFTVDQYHPLCALATLGFSDCRAPFFAGAKLPSRKASSHCKKPSWSRAPSSARQAANQTPFSSHCRSRRQQVEGEGNSSGRNRHAAPVCRIHRMPAKQARLAAGGLPRPSRRRRTLGNNGSINSHCSSVNSFCRVFITEAHH
jgi:hypothetical protein